MGLWKRRLGSLLHIWANGAVPRVRRRGENWWAGAEEFEPRLLMAAGPATQVVFTIEPSNVAAGSVMQPTVSVTVEDAQGNPVTTGSAASEKVMLTISAGPTTSFSQTLGTAVSATAVAGIANFTSLTFTTTGMYTLTATGSAVPGGSLSSAFSVGPSPAKLVFIQGPSSTTAGNPFSSIIVAVEDANGNPVTTDDSNVTLTIPGSAGALSGTTVQSTLNNSGEATFNGLSLSKAGTYTILATDGSLASATSAQFTISPGAASKLGFVQQPTNVAQSSVIAPPVTVAVEDQFGNVITTDTSAVSLSLGQSGVLSGTTTQNTVNGVATFNDLSLSQAGNYTLVANDNGLTVTSTGFAVTGPPSKLAFQRGPTQTMINTSISPSIVVAVEDSAGNVVATDNSAVTLTILSGPGSISGTTTVNAVNGLATFTGISFNAVGNYTLEATDGTLTMSDSSPFIINGPAAQLAFTVQPPGGAASAALSPAVQVSVEDAQGNVVVNSGIQITLSLNGVGATLGGTTVATASNGVATFNNLIVSAKGTFTLSAASGTLTGATSASFVLTPSASMLVIATGPTNTAATAVASPIVINVEDPTPEVVTTNSSSVTVAIASGPANASIGGTTTVSAVKGVATFSNLTFATPGTYTLFFSDGSLNTATSGPFTVNQPPSKLVFTTEPSSVQAASTSNETVVVTVEDKSGHVVTTDHSTITLTAGTTGTLTGTTSVVAVNGVATFNNLVFTTTGTQTLSATDGSLTSATSSKFTILPALSAQNERLIISQATTGSTLVATAVAPIKVTVEDQFGNVVTTDREPILLRVPATSTTYKVNASKGVAIFNGIKFNAAGIYVVQAAEGDLNVATQFTQSITPGVAYFSSVKTPTTLLPGQALQVSVQLKSNAPSSVPFSDDSPSPGSITLSLFTPNGTAGTLTPLQGGVIGSKGTFSFDVADFPQGVSTLTLTYAGDQSQTGALYTFAVDDQAPTTTTLAVSNPSKTASFGSSLTLTAHVSTNATSPALGGIVEFFDGKALVGTQTLSSIGNAGSAALTIENLADGKHSYTAVYENDPNYRTSSSKASSALTVSGRGTTSIMLTPSSNSITYGDSLTITATILNNATNVPMTGVVHLIDDGKDIADATVGSNGIATLVATTSFDGTAVVTYSGDTNFGSSSSAAISSVITINAASTGLLITAPSNPKTNAPSFVLVQVTTSAFLADTSGTVTISGSGQNDTGQVIGGFASVTIPAGLTAGTYTFTVSYTPQNPDLLSASSSPLTLNVT